MNILRPASLLPEVHGEVFFNIPQIRLVGNASAHVENYTALVEYRRDNVKLKYRGGIIEISGKNLEISAVGEGNIIICGKIEAVKLI